MKLVEILATKLKEWPYRYTKASFTQDPDGRVFMGTEPYWSEDSEWCGVGWVEIPPHGNIFPLAEDYKTAIVTKVMWEAEVKRLDESLDYTSAEYNPIQQQTHYDENPNPLAMRDRIYEINSTIESLSAEREELISLLRDEGFILAEVVKDGSDGVVNNIPHWRDWEVGDILEVVSEEEGHGYDIGDLIEIINIDGTSLPFETKHCEDPDAHDYDWVNHREVKWVSRP